jgi:long-subunit acyl-CoA synthetase (AMP-forming)
MISHHNVIAQIMQMRSLTAPDCPKVMLGVLPLYHSESRTSPSALPDLLGSSANAASVTGIVQILQLPLALNQEVVLMAKFNLQEMMDVIYKYQCDELWLVPRESMSSDGAIVCGISGTFRC